MKTAKKLTLIMILVLTGIPAYAADSAPEDLQQERSFTPDRGQGGPRSEERREEVRRKIDAIRIWRLTEELKLDADTSGKLSSLLSSVDQKRREIQREQKQIMITLRQSLDAQKPDESKIRQLLDELENNHRAVAELKNTELKGAKELLTVEQQARFLIFKFDFQREMRDMIAGARGGGLRPGPGNGRMRGGQNLKD